MPGTTLYESHRSRLLWWLLVLVLAPVPLTGWLVTLPGPDRLLAEFGSLGTARTWQIGLVLISSVMFWPLLWLSGRYATRVQDLGARRVRVEVWTLLGRRSREWTPTLAGGEYHDGQLAIPGRPKVDAPWIRYRTPEGRTLVIDAQGEFPLGIEALHVALSAGIAP